MKSKLISIILYFSVICVLAGLVIWLNLSWRPDIVQLHPDSGFYAYVGRAILHGQVLYKDLWDNKPPFGYYLNALGLLLFGQTPWGVWWFSVLWMTGSSLLSFLVFKKLFGWVTGLITSLLFITALMNPQLFQGGNLTEVFALTPQLGIIGAVYLFFNRGQKARFAVLTGLMTAAALLIKQPTIALGISAIVVMSIRMVSAGDLRGALKIIAAFTLGFIGLFALVSLYLLSQGAFGGFIDGAFRQAISSLGGAQSSFRTFFKHALSIVLPRLFISKLYVIALLVSVVLLVGKLYHYWLKQVLLARLPWFDWALVIGLVIFPIVARRFLPGPYSFVFWLISLSIAAILLLLRFTRLGVAQAHRQVFSPIEWTWLIAVIALPTEVFMASLGGRYYPHYFITMIPATILAAALPIWKIASLLSSASSSSRHLLANTAYAILSVGVLIWGGFGFSQAIPSPVYTKNFAGIFDPRFELNEMQQYIVDTTQPTDTVLVWHIHLGINFVTERYAPSRFLYPLNLFIPPSPTNDKLKQYVDELENHPPRLIVVQKVSSLGLPFVNQPLDSLCDANCTTVFSQAIRIPEIRQQWLRFQQFFEANYVTSAEIYDWIIYRKLP